MSALTNFLSIPDPIALNQKLLLGKNCQNFCSKRPNIFSRLVVGVIVKDVAHICAIAIHAIAGIGKLMICATKITYSIPARIWGSAFNYQTGKEGLIHLGLSGFFVIDIFISFTNIINRYPQDLTRRVEDFFGRLLQIPKQKPKDDLIQKQEGSQTESPGHLDPKYLKNHPPEDAQEIARIYAESYSRLFPTLSAEYLRDNKSQKNVEKKAKVYAQNCLRIYSAIYLKFSKISTKEEAEKQALLYAKVYVNAYATEFAKQPKNYPESRKRADTYAKDFTELFFVEYPNYLKNHPPEDAQEIARIYAESHLRLFPELHEEYLKNTKEESAEERAKIYAQDYIKIYSSIYLKFSKTHTKEAAEEKALLYAKVYVNAYSAEFAKQLKNHPEEEAKRQAEIYAKHINKIFFIEYPNYSKTHTKEAAEEKALLYAKVYVKAYSAEFAKQLKNHIEEDKNTADAYAKYFTKVFLKEYPKHLEKCTPETAEKKAKKAAKKQTAYYAKKSTQALTPAMVEKFIKRKTQSTLHKKPKLKNNKTNI